jgi:hypothetical protein
MKTRYLCALCSSGCLLFGGNVMAQTQQQHVHGMAHSVMPFDMAKTTHIFRMTESGGTERVIVKDKADAGQVALIQQHLREEAARFELGDYGDPAKLHGAGMPGLSSQSAPSDCSFPWRGRRALERQRRQ